MGSVLDQTTIIREENGDVSHYHGYLVDITPRVAMEKELGFLNSIVDMTHDPLYVVSADQDLTLIYANQAAREILSCQSGSSISLYESNKEFAAQNFDALERIELQG